LLTRERAESRNERERALMEWLVLSFLSAGIAAFGYGLVLLASRIERHRRARHIDQFGDHQPNRVATKKKPRRAPGQG
jgi:hypothetical protein